MGFLHCTLECPDRSVELVVADVESEFIGVSVTERNGLEMKRIGGDLNNVKDIRAMRDLLTAFLERHNG